MNLLITGVAGFIGYNLTKELIKKKHQIFGIDLSINKLKNINKDRIKKLKKIQRFQFNSINIENYYILNKHIKKYKIKYVIHLAAKAGVRESLIDTTKYFNTNIKGFYNILEVCRHQKIKHLLFASSSSVYGNTKKFPSKEIHNTDKPESFYAATKKINEILGYSYASTYKLPCTGIRFFTVYGPYGREDMAIFKFVKNTLKNQYIKLHNKANHSRDFTYIDDATKLLNKIIFAPSKHKVPFQIFNIGSGKSINLSKLLNIIEKKLNKKIKSKKIEFQKGDVLKTQSDIKLVKKIFNYQSFTDTKKGINKFIDWYYSYKLKK